jgi:hypothetical protein
MTENIRTIEELRARVAADEIKAAEALAWRVFCNEYPQYAFDANLAIFREFHHGEPITKRSLNESFPFVKGKLAVKGQVRIEQETIDRELEDRSELSSLSVEQLRERIRQSKEDTPLPEEITAQVIRDASPDQIRFWFKKYGSKMINLRLSSAAGRK